MVLLTLLLSCRRAEPPDVVAPGGGAPGEPVRFVAFGDAGTGEPAQQKVADAVARVCAERGCDLILGLGDNLYYEGAETPDDPQFQDKFERPYAGISQTFYMVMGNHDYGGSTIDRDRADAQLAYAARSPRWEMPAPYYRFRYGDVEFFALDTNLLYSGWALGWAGEEVDWLSRALPASNAPWKVVYGHHPWRSNGQHGDAGDYEGAFLGGWLRDIFEEQLCGRADLYLSGHDHNRQWLEPQCGVELVVSGAGAKTAPLLHRTPAPTLWEDDQEPGFLWAEIHGDTLTGIFFNADGIAQLDRSINRNRDRTLLR